MSGDYDDSGGHSTTSDVHNGDSNQQQGDVDHNQGAGDKHLDAGLPQQHDNDHHPMGLPEQHSNDHQPMALPEQHDYSHVVAQHPELAQADDAHILHPLFEAINSRLDDAAREHREPPGHTSEATFHAVTAELTQTFHAIVQGGDPAAAAHKWSEGFVNSITAPQGHDAIVHGIHAVGGAMQFAASVMHAAVEEK
jgi:hypothetical protein